jgi:hypothetical protein
MKRGLFPKTSMLLLGVLSLNAACHDFTITEKEGAPPVRSMRTIKSESRSETFIQFEADIDYRNLLDLSFFAGLSPGISIEQATRVLGQPTQVENLSDGQREAIFAQDDGYIKVSWKKDSSWGDYWSWRLRYYPVDGGELARFLPTNLLQQLDTSSPQTTLTVRNLGRPPGILYRMKEGRVEYVEWIPGEPEQDAK